MKILVIGTGKSIHDLKWIKFLAENTPHTFYFVSEAPNDPDVNDKEKYRSAGVKLMEPLPPFFLSSPWRTIQGFTHIRKIIQSQKIDMVHVIFPTPHLYWMTFSKRPTLVTTRGSDVLVVIRSLIEEPGIKNKILLYLMRRNLKKVKHITCTSELQQSFLTKHFPFVKGKTSIVRTGINLAFVDQIKPQPQPVDRIGKQTIFSPRFFSPLYNILAQIHALKKFSIEKQQSIFVIFVRGKIFDLAYQAQIMDALQHAHFQYKIYDYLSQEQMIQQYKSSDLVIMTPHSDGTPNSALEAMACKKPLIISDLDYNSPLFEETCLKANPKDEQDIFEKIQIGLASYPEQYLVNASHALNEYGNQEVEMKKIMDCYMSILNE